MEFSNQQQQRPFSPTQTVYLIGLSIHSLSFAKHLLLNYGFVVKIISNIDIPELIRNQEYGHLFEYNRYDDLYCTFLDLQSTLHHFSNGLVSEKCLRKIDNFEIYEKDHCQLDRMKMNNLIGNQIEVTFEYTVIHNKTFLIEPFQLIYDLYNSINTYPNFQHIVVGHGFTTLENYLTKIPIFENLKIINFINFSSKNTLRKQILLVRSNQLIKSSFISKTKLDQFTRLLPLSETENYISISGPIQFNDSFKYPRDSDTLSLISRAKLKFPILGQIDLNSIVRARVFFRDCFPDRLSRIWIQQLSNGSKIINCCGFGFEEIDSIGGVIENLTMLLNESRSKI